MITIILDKKFADDFQSKYCNVVDDEYFNDFLKYFLKNLRSFKLVTNFTENEFIKEAKINPLLLLIINRYPIISYNQDVQNCIDSISYLLSESPFKLVLTGVDNKRCISQRKRFGIEYLNMSNLSERWKLHYSHRPDIYKKTTTDTQISEDHRFDSWDKLKDFCHPLNSIIIVDFYLLKWRTEHDLSKNLSNNILPLLDNLCLQASSEIPIEITFISEFNELPNYSQSQFVIKSKDIISKEFALISNQEFNINIIVHNKSNYPQEFQDFHDRLIITNYFYIECGAGFSIFNKQGQIIKSKKNTEIKFRSVLNIQNTESVFYDLKQLDIYCKKLVNYEGSKTLNFYPTNTNRLLNVL